MPKLDEKMDAILEVIFTSKWRQRAFSAGIAMPVRQDLRPEFLTERAQLGLRQGRAGLCSLRDARRPSCGERL